MRSFVQHAGALTGQDESTFFLSTGEILALLEGNETPLAYIPAQRAVYERYCALPSYPALIRGRFDPFQWAADPQRRSDFLDASHVLGASASDTITAYRAHRASLRAGRERSQVQRRVTSCRPAKCW